MKSTASNGLSLLAGANRPSLKPSPASTPRLKSLPSRRMADVISLDARRAQRRAMRAAWNILVTAVVAMAFIGTAAALHREQRLQTVEAGR